MQQRSRCNNSPDLWLHHVCEFTVHFCDVSAMFQLDAQTNDAGPVNRRWMPDPTLQCLA
jgi:hypothetical protein